jgi:hypothetical protein
MSIFCTVIPQTNAERIEDWLNKDGPLRRFEEVWPGVPLDVVHAIEYGQFTPLPDYMRRQAE